MYRVYEDNGSDSDFDGPLTTETELDMAEHHAMWYTYDNLIPTRVVRILVDDCESLVLRMSVEKASTLLQP